MRKFAATWFLFSFTCLALLMGATCIDTATGTDPKAGTAAPGNPVAVAGGVVGSLPIPFAGLIGAAITAFPGVWALFRGRQWKNAALATAAATGKIVSALPDSNAKKAALTILNDVHDAADVAESLQTAVQNTAAAHAGV